MERRLAEAQKAYLEEQYLMAKQIYEDVLRSEIDSETSHKCRVNIACCLAGLEDYQSALDTLESCKSSKDVECIFNRALCQFKLANYSLTVKLADELIDMSRIQFPRVFDQELTASDDTSIDSCIEDSCLIEALNLKAAAHYCLNHNLEEAKAHLESLPVKDVDKLDCVTLHNKTIFGCMQDIDSSLDTLLHLTIEQADDRRSSQVACRSQAVVNYLILLLASGKDEISIDTLKKHDSINDLLIGMNIKELFEAELKLDDTATSKSLEKLLENLMNYIKLSKAGKTAAKERANDLTLVVSSLLGSIYWEQNQFSPLEKLFLKVNHALSANQIWKTNIAHFNYIQDVRFEACCELYESLLPETESTNLTHVDPLLLANLCVSYVLTGRNADAEDLIKDIESDELQVLELARPEEFEILPKSGHRNQTMHMSMINLVIGTLYCIKHNFEFGMSRVMKATQPMDRNLNQWTWFHVKRCILYLLENQCKQVALVSDELMDQIVSFLKQCEERGATLSPDSLVNWSTQSGDKSHTAGFNSLVYEARYLRAILLPMIHD